VAITREDIFAEVSSYQRRVPEMISFYFTQNNTKFTITFMSLVA